MKKVYFLTLFLAGALIANAQLSVVFSVDMSDEELFTPGTDMLTIGGSFQNWSPGNQIFEDGDGDGIYTLTLTDGDGDIMLAAGQELRFKFVINNWNGTCETCNNEFHPDTPGNPEGCTEDDGAGNINRLITLPSDATGTYELPTYKYNSCEVVSSVNQISTAEGIRISPNPATDRTIISFSNPTQTTHTITLHSLTGKTVQVMQNVRGENVEVTTATLPKGLYFVTFRNELGETTTHKLMVQ